MSGLLARQGKYLEYKVMLPMIQQPLQKDVVQKNFVRHKSFKTQSYSENESDSSNNYTTLYAICNNYRRVFNLCSINCAVQPVSSKAIKEKTIRDCFQLGS